MTTYSEIFPTELLSVMSSEIDAMQQDVEYAWDFRNTTLAVDLVVPSDAIDGGALDVATAAYTSWLQKNLDLGWFTMHVMAIPCIYVGALKSWPRSVSE